MNASSLVHTPKSQPQRFAELGRGEGRQDREDVNSIAKAWGPTWPFRSHP